MVRWIAVIAGGICSTLSFYMAFLAFNVGDSGVYLFSAFGLFFCALLLAAVIPIMAKHSNFFRKISERLSGPPRPVTFVPHGFIMAAIITTAVVILAAILFPMLFR
ncbi:MAG: hypothetical protein WC799_14175 [Desulfobacteraceae bacterium]